MPQTQPLFIVTTFTKLEKDHKYDWYEFGDTRTVGIFPSLEEARNVVENNVCDIFETIYDYALIEEVTFGLYPDLISQELYHVKNTTTKTNTGKELIDYTYQRIELPEDFQSYSIIIG